MSTKSKTPKHTLGFLAPRGQNHYLGPYLGPYLGSPRQLPPPKPIIHTTGGKMTTRKLKRCRNKIYNSCRKKKRKTKKKY